METLIGFMVGYVVGTRQGRDGLRKAREAFDAIRTSPQVHQMVLGGASMAGGVIRQVLGGGTGAVLTGALDALARKATDAMSGGSDSDVRQAG